MRQLSIYSGNPLDRHYPHVQQFELLPEKAGLGELCFHDLRHAYASLAIVAGTALQGPTAGRGSFLDNIIMDSYAHLFPGYCDQPLRRLGDMFSEGGKAKDEGAERRR